MRKRCPRASFSYPNTTLTRSAWATGSPGLCILDSFHSLSFWSLWKLSKKKSWLLFSSSPTLLCCNLCVGNLTERTAATCVHCLSLRFKKKLKIKLPGSLSHPSPLLPPFSDKTTCEYFFLAMNKQTCPSSGPAAFSVFQLRIKTNICRLLASGRKCEEWGRAGAFVLSEWEQQALKHVGRPSSVCTLPVFLSTLNLKQKDENSACDCWSLTVKQTSESDSSRLTVWAGSKNSAVTTCSWAFREKPPAKDFKTFSFPVTGM